jgi:hypothetical protein
MNYCRPLISFIKGQDLIIMKQNEQVFLIINTIIKRNE